MREISSMTCKFDAKYKLFTVEIVSRDNFVLYISHFHTLYVLNKLLKAQPGLFKFVHQWLRIKNKSPITFSPGDWGHIECRESWILLLIGCHRDAMNSLHNDAKRNADLTMSALLGTTQHRR